MTLLAPRLARLLLTLVVGGLAVASSGCPASVAAGDCTGAACPAPKDDKPPKFFVDPPFGLGFDCITLGCDVERSMTVENTGGGDLALSFINATVGTSSDFTVRRADGEPLPTHDNIVKLKGGETMEIVVRYVPSDEIVDEGAITFEHFDGAKKFEDVAPDSDDLPLSTRQLGAPAAVTDVNEPVLDFGFVPVGTTVTLEVHVQNGGQDGVLRVGPAALEDGSPDAFHPPTPADWGDHFANPGDDAVIPVSFTPATTDAFFGALLLDTNDGGRPGIRVHLQGTAIAEPRLVVVTPTGDLNLASARINEERHGSIVVQNVGGASLAVNAAITSGADLGYSVTPSLASLAPLATATFDVALLNGNGGDILGVVGLTSNDPASPAGTLVNVTCKVNAPRLSSSPGSIDFGDIVQGWTADAQTVSIGNTGFGELTITSIQLEVGSSSQISLVNVPSLPVKLSPGDAPITVSALFQAQAIGPADAVLLVGSDSIDTTVSRINLHGDVITCAQGCPIPNGAPDCSSGRCEIASCSASFHDADTLAVNGCECGEDPGGDIASACNSRGELGTFDDCGGAPDGRDVFGSIHELSDVDTYHFDTIDTSAVFRCDTTSDSSQTSAELLSAPIGLALCGNIQGSGTGCGGNSTFFDPGRCKVFNGSPVEFHHCGGFASDDDRSMTFWLMWAPNANPVCGNYQVRIRGKEDHLCN
jgi:hypothetical protein